MVFFQAISFSSPLPPPPPPINFRRHASLKVQARREPKASNVVFKSAQARDVRLQGWEF